jgi:hypothetical protein
MSEQKSCASDSLKSGAKDVLNVGATNSLLFSSDRQLGAAIPVDGAACIKKTVTICVLVFL